MDGLVEAVEYEFRVTSVNRAGAGSSSIVSNAVLAKDPIRELVFFFFFFFCLCLGYVSRPIIFLCFFF